MRRTIVTEARDMLMEEHKKQGKMVDGQPHNYIAISKEGNVKVGGISLVLDQSAEYLLGFLQLGYSEQSYWKTQQKNFIILDRNDEILDCIKLSNWTVHFVFNVWDRYGYNGLNTVLTKNEAPEEQITYYVPRFSEFQEVWDFITEVDGNCKFTESARIYKDFYEKRLELDLSKRKYDRLEKELANANEIINQYQKLIKIIEEKVSS